MKTNQQLLNDAYEAIEKHEAAVRQDPYRLGFHLMPPVGLLNDPNGWIQFKGIYHLFYQWNPFQTAHGSKYWGHFTSKDLVSWKEEPPALAPEKWYEKNGCYSGSAIEKDGQLVLFYTGNVKDENGRRESYQCMAVSDDGIHFEKKGPVLTVPDGYTAHFRDPKVWKENNVWYMIIGAQDKQEQGKAVLFRSDDLKKWELAGPVAGSYQNELGEFGYMWECPDFFHLDGEDVLLVSPQGLEADGHLFENLFQAGSFLGKLDYEQASFQHGAFQELDRGFDFYAPQTTLDDQGRRLLFAWMGMTDENEQHQPTHAHHWVHAMTLPRELFIENGKLCQKPVKELEQLRGKETSCTVALQAESKQLENVDGDTLELKLDEIQVEDGIVDIRIRGNAVLRWNREAGWFTLERQSFDGTRTEYRHCEVEDLHSLHLFLDTSSLEVFINGGEEVFTARFFPEPDNTSLVFTSTGAARFQLHKWDINRQKFKESLE